MSNKSGRRLFLKSKTKGSLSLINGCSGSDAAAMGSAAVCHAEFSTHADYGPKIEMIRDKTLMQGVAAEIISMPGQDNRIINLYKSKDETISNIFVDINYTKVFYSIYKSKRRKT